MIEEIKKDVESIKSDIADIDTEISEVDRKGVFSYARAKSIRKTALEISRKAKDLRFTTLNEFNKTKTAKTAE